METQKTVNLLTGSDNENSKFATKKWYVIDSESKGKYSKDDDPIKFSTKSIESSLYDYSDAYILVTGNITATPNNGAAQVAFKDCAPFKEIVEQKLMTLLLIMQILLILQCLCTI